MRIVSSPNSFGIVTRRLLPAAAVLIILIAWVRLAGQLAHWYGTEFGLTVLVAVTIFMFCGLVLVVARSIRRSDVRREVAERSLEEGRIQFEAILQSAMDAIITLDENQKILVVNASAETMFGYQAADLIGQSIDLLIPKGFREQHDERVTDFGESRVTALKMGALRSLSGLRSGGEEFPVEASISRARVSDRLLYTLILRDVTERVRIENELRITRERFFKAFSASANPASITALESGRYVDVNESFLQATGFSREEVIGRTATELGIWAEAGQRTPIVNALKSGQPIRNLEHRYRNKKGEERIWLLCADLIDLDGEPCIIGSRTDVTERKRVEEELARSEVSFRELFSNNPIPMWVFEKRTLRFLQVNDAAVERYGYSREEFMRMSIEQIRPSGELPNLSNLIQRYMTSSRVSEEARHRTRDGKLLDVHIVAQDFKMDGKDARLVVSYDITEEKRAANQIALLNVELENRVTERTAQLAAANKELEAFSYSVSHDLRAPLRSIDGFSKALLEDYADKLDNPGRNYLERVRSATQNMAQLIDDLLELSRVTRAEMRREKVDLSSIAISVLTELQRLEPMREVKVHVEQGLIAVADHRLMRVVLQNLLSNSWKFTSKRKSQEIQFGAASNNGHIVYQVKDNGAGFDMAYSGKLFGPFQRLHSAKEFPGTGIGLATVQRIINRHGGKVWAEGSIDNGATFYFTL